MNVNVYQVDSEPKWRAAADGERDESAFFLFQPIHSNRFKWFVLVWLTFGLPTGLIHASAIRISDTPQSAPISVTQGATAVVANLLGPWSGHAVRAVQFPNAGLRNFSLPAALGLTAAFFAIVGVGIRVEHRLVLWTALGLFSVLMLIWYGYGFFLITDGLL